MDYERISRELVRALRGTRSQAGCARRLRCTSNVLHAWEHGARYPSLGHFAALVRISGGDLAQAFAAVSNDPAPTARAKRPLSWLRSLLADKSVSEIAQAVLRSRNTVARWLSGETEPRLPDVLRLVHVSTLRLLEFLGSIVDPAQLPSLTGAFGDLAAQRAVAYELPWSHAVLRALELQSYLSLPRHVRGFLAAQLGVSVELEDECLGALQASGQIEERAGKWHSVRVLAVDTRSDRARNIALKRHWAELALSRFGPDGPPSGSLYSYNLFAISDEGLAEIQRLHLAYYEKVRAVVDACTEPTKVALINVQLLPLRP